MLTASMMQAEAVATSQQGSEGTWFRVKGLGFKVLTYWSRGSGGVKIGTIIGVYRRSIWASSRDPP